MTEGDLPPADEAGGRPAADRPQVPAWAWLVWAVLTLVTLGVLEVWAIRNGPSPDTLSERIRALLGIDPPDPRRRIGIPLFLAVVLGFVAWFVPHILFG